MGCPLFKIIMEAIQENAGKPRTWLPGEREKALARVDELRQVLDTWPDVEAELSKAMDKEMEFVLSKQAAIAHLAERLSCKEKVEGSRPSGGLFGY